MPSTMPSGEWFFVLTFPMDHCQIFNPCILYLDNIHDWCLLRFTTRRFHLSVFDRTGTGVIPAREFSTFSRILGEPLSEAESMYYIHVLTSGPTIL